MISFCLADKVNFIFKKWGTDAEGLWVTYPVVKRWYPAELGLSKAFRRQIHQKLNQASQGCWVPLLPAQAFSFSTQRVPFPLCHCSPLRQHCAEGTVPALGPEDFEFDSWFNFSLATSEPQFLYLLKYSNNSPLQCSVRVVREGHCTWLIHSRCLSNRYIFCVVFLLLYL